MRRFSLFIASLLLVSCAKGGDQPPADVLSKAAAASQKLESSRFNASVTYKAKGAMPMNMNAAMNGVIANAGRTVSFSIDGNAKLPIDGSSRTVTLKGDVLVPTEREVYVRIRELQGSLSSLLPGIDLISEDVQGMWLRLPERDGEIPSNLTPDPSLLLMQVEGIKIVTDRSYDRIDGRKSYVYDVELDPEKMLNFLKEIGRRRNEVFDEAAAREQLATFKPTGTMWIDAETYHVRRIEWTLTNEQIEGVFSIQFSEHNEPITIAPPESALPLPSAVSSGVFLPHL